MGELIDDEILSTFAVVGEQDAIAQGFRDRYGDCIDRLSFYSTDSEAGPDFWEPIVADLAS
jgi:hypothetical protein